jgi:hypothetical protein
MTVPHICPVLADVGFDGFTGHALYGQLTLIKII